MIYGNTDLESLPHQNCAPLGCKLIEHRFPNSGSATMKLQINGEERSLAESPNPFTLAALIETLGMKSDRVAVELNRDVVPRNLWSETLLSDGDRLEVVHFVGGGLHPDSSRELS
jgi:sulfur carrier protein